MKQALICFLVATFASSICGDESFYEELLIRPLPDGKLMTHFQFTTRWDVNKSQSSSFNHFNLFPKSLGNVIRKFHVDELHLSFTQGRWVFSQWGYPVNAAPAGVELWTWFEDGYDTNSLWKGLASTLSGLFCATLDQMGITNTINPQFSFTHDGDSYFGRTSNNSEGNLRYSALAREAVCTENLTPWMKLLPCRGKVGLGYLLNSLKLYDTHYHSMQTHLKSRCLEKVGCKNPTLELVQTLTVVFEVPQKVEVSFLSLFGRTDLVPCPLASESRIYIQKNSNFEIVPNPQPTSSDAQLDTYDLKTMTNPLSLKLKMNPKENKKAPKEAQLSASRVFTGQGLEYGGFAVYLTNNHDTPLKISYFETVPWYLKIYFHTLEMSINGAEVDPFQVMENFTFIPAEDHGKPTKVEFIMTLPPKSSTIFTLQFEKAFLHWTEYPPDAHRGFDIGSAVVTGFFDSKHEDLQFNGLEWSPILYTKTPRKQVNFKVYSEALLMSLPTPDFSMPYNVMTLSGTVFALFFGSMFTTMVRRLKNVDKQDSFVSNRPIFKILSSVFKFLDRD